MKHRTDVRSILTGATETGRTPDPRRPLYYITHRFKFWQPVSYTENGNKFRIQGAVSGT